MDYTAITGRQEIARSTNSTLKTIIVVDDEKTVLDLLALSLAGRYKVLTAGGAGAALEVWENHSGRIDLALLDCVMPDMNGPNLARILRELDGDIAIIFMSGYPEDTVANATDIPNFQFVSKPFTLRDLEGKISQAFETPTALRVQPRPVFTNGE
jgi:two-component system cell cycle sensor histidine kinase/response regulator CckA